METLVADILNTSATEWVAVVLSLAYLILAIRRSIWCWPNAFVSTALFVYLFFDAALPMQSLLNAYYMAMAVYGFINWRRSTSATTISDIVRYPLRFHLFAIGGLVLLSLASADLISRLSPGAANMPLLDSLTAWSAVFATWLLARREFNNWYYWLVIDAIAVFVYLRSGLALTALLFTVNLSLIPFGIVSWHKAAQHDQRA